MTASTISPLSVTLPIGTNYPDSAETSFLETLKAFESDFQYAYNAGAFGNENANKLLQDVAAHLAEKLDALLRSSDPAERAFANKFLKDTTFGNNTIQLKMLLDAATEPTSDDFQTLLNDIGVQEYQYQNMQQGIQQFLKGPF